MPPPFDAQIHAVTRGRDLVLLDVATGAYLCLPDAADAVRPVSPCGDLEICDPEVARMLSEANLLPPGGRLSSPGADVPCPGRDLADLPPSPMRWKEAPAFVASLSTLAPNYYGRSFRHLVAAGRRGACRSVTPQPTERLLTAVAQFRRWAPWAPFPGLCLYRSYALLRWLRRRGLHARWMFGVQTWPFAAHCWLQVGDLVLDDCAEVAAAYSIILIV